MGKIIKNGIVYGGGGGGSGSGHTIMDTDGNFMPAENNLQFIGLDVTDNSSDGITEVESATLNQDSLDDIMSAGAAGNQVASNGLVYSTTEQVVGKWIDGKPLYQKTYTGTTPSNFSPTSSYRISLGLGANSYTICRTFGSCNSVTRTYVPLHYTNTVGGNVYFFDAYGVNSSDELVFVGTSNYASCNYAVTVQYTKDAD